MRESAHRRYWRESTKQHPHKKKLGRHRPSHKPGCFIRQIDDGDLMHPDYFTSTRESYLQLLLLPPVAAILPTLLQRIHGVILLPTLSLCNIARSYRGQIRHIMTDRYDDLELKFGISAYASPHEGFAAVVKARYSDFVVHEGA
jgi:hypothetical protein